ncbi:hypothetical protein BN1013_01848 [Candidatus Rubidus massiliensis]|nr:hypothetical protein BN1013_01848 [Candidatus Rubidus massiliensis]
MKKYIKTGLLLLLPLLITFAIVRLVVNVCTNPFLKPIQSFLGQYSFFQTSHLFFSSAQFIAIASKALIIIFLLTTIFFLGYLANWFFFRQILKISDYLILHLPFIKKIYKPLQDATNSLFGSDKKSFSKVVLVPFPNERALSIGLISNEDATKTSDPSFQEQISIFVPGIPNPSVGFMLLFKREELIDLDMTIEEAFKFLVSCGMLDIPLKNKSL